MEDATIRKEVVENRIKEVSNENEIDEKRFALRNEEIKQKDEEKFNLINDINLIKADISTLSAKQIGLK